MLVFSSILFGGFSCEIDLALPIVHVDTETSNKNRHEKETLKTNLFFPHYLKKGYRVDYEKLRFVGWWFICEYSKKNPL